MIYTTIFKYQKILVTKKQKEYRPFYMIKELYPRYLFTMDLLLQKRDGIIHENS